MDIRPKKHLKHLAAGALIALLAACQQQPVSTSEPITQVKIGKPYVIDGKTYYPEYDPAYDEVGEASWYGPGFHGKYTANGEIFDQNDLTAAHPTLPMPSLVRVTNLASGKSLVVRINDRGPFRNNRIIDLSKGSAQRLGIKGVAQVRVQFMPKETATYLANAGSGKSIDMFALNESLAHPQATTAIAVNEAPVEPVKRIELGPDPAPIQTASAEPRSFQPPPRRKAPATSSSSSSSHSGLIKEAWAGDANGREVPAVQDEGLVIQVGSFSTEKNANRIKSKLASLGAVNVDKVVINDKTWYRVRLGPFNDKPSAENALSKVHSAGAPDARIRKI